MNVLKMIEPLVKPSGSVLVLMFMVVYFSFSMGALTGSEVHIDGDETVSEAQAELAEGEAELQAEMERDYTGIQGTAVMFVVGPVITLTWDAASVGVSIGHKFPTLAEYHAYAFPYVSIAVVVGTFIHQFRKIGKATAS